MISEEAVVVLPPIAGESTFRIMTSLFLQEFDDPWMGFENLVLPGPTVIGEVVGSSESGGQVDQTTEGLRGACDPFLIVIDMEVEDDAGIVSASPGEEALGVLLNEPDRSVNHRDGASAKEGCRAFHEEREFFPGNIKLADHFAPGDFGPKVLVEPGVVVLQINGELMGVGPINGTVGLKVEIGVFLKSGPAIKVGQRDQFPPVGSLQASL